MNIPAEFKPLLEKASQNNRIMLVVAENGTTYSQFVRENKDFLKRKYFKRAKTWEDFRDLNLTNCFILLLMPLEETSEELRKQLNTQIAMGTTVHAMYVEN